MNKLLVGGVEYKIDISYMGRENTIWEVKNEEDVLGNKVFYLEEINSKERKDIKVIKYLTPIC